MKEYEYRKKVFYQLYGHLDFPDEHKNFDYKICKSTVVDDAVSYLVDGSTYLKFPGAARAVAVATADFVSRHFNEDFYEVLNDQGLMFDNDPFFKTYLEDKLIYDEIIEKIEVKAINWLSLRMDITHKLLQEEYMLNDEGLIIIPREEWKTLQSS